MAFCPACRQTYPDDWRQCPVHSLSLLPSERIGKYVVDGLIGMGGMGAVYRATNPDTRSRVAVKVLHPSASGIESARIRFQREAAAVAALKTRHVVTIHDFGEGTTGMLYLVMELLEGHTVRDEISHGNIPLPRIGRMLDHALRGLSAAHRSGIVHRDLKPENLFLAATDDGEVLKILDFGIARTDSGKDTGLTGSGALMGTPAYMAPEQIAGNRGDIGPWTDAYAMGVIIYELLSEQSPFAGDSVSAVLGRILSREFEPLANVRRGLPSAIYDLVDTALADDPTQRFPNSEALLEAWNAAWEALPSKQRSAPVPDFAGPAHAGSVVDPNSATDFASPTAPTEHASDNPTTPSKSKSPGMWLGALLGAVVIAAAVMYMVMRKSDPPAPPPVIAAIDARVAALDAAAPPLTAKIPEGMVLLQGGVFEMGPDEKQYTDQPSVLRAQVEVSPFYLDKLEAVDPASGLPIRRITHTRAAEYCAARSKRLPTEAEWEFAARQHELRDDDACLLRKGTNSPAEPGTHDGDCTPAGACDFLGNVAEWTSESWRDTQDAPATADRVVRGGSYKVAPGGFYSSPFARYPRPADARDDEVGFRCAMSAE